MDVKTIFFYWHIKKQKITMKQHLYKWMHGKLPPGVDAEEKHQGLNRNALILVCPLF